MHTYFPDSLLSLTKPGTADYVTCTNGGLWYLEGKKSQLKYALKSTV